MTHHRTGPGDVTTYTVVTGRDAAEVTRHVVVRSHGRRPLAAGTDLTVLVAPTDPGYGELPGQPFRDRGRSFYGLAAAGVFGVLGLAYLALGAPVWRLWRRAAVDR